MIWHKLFLIQLHEGVEILTIFEPFFRMEQNDMIQIPFNCLRQLWLLAYVSMSKLLMCCLSRANIFSSVQIHQHEKLLFAKIIFKSLSVVRGHTYFCLNGLNSRWRFKRIIHPVTSSVDKTLVASVTCSLSCALWWQARFWKMILCCVCFNGNLNRCERRHL